MAKVNGEIEEGLMLIGSTAIEDRLQDDVDQTIQFAKSAGVKVWVLTGDKIGTAINIGFSAGLLDNDENMDQHIIREDANVDKLIDELSQILGDLKKHDMEHQTSQIITGSENVYKKKQAIIVAGASLVLLDHLDACK